VTTLAHQLPQLTRANGIEICYEIFGDANAEPLLLIMGLGAQMIHWDDEFCRQLAARGFRVIRFDNRDIGKSKRLNLDSWRRRPLLEKGRELVWTYFGEVF